jgi:hypothetical protein
VHAVGALPDRLAQAGQKVQGVTVAELGAGNRPLDMILYKKDGTDFLLMSNNSRGVMKIRAGDVAGASPITAPVTTPTWWRRLRDDRRHAGHRAAGSARRAELDRHRARQWRSESPGRSAAVIRRGLLAAAMAGLVPAPRVQPMP